LPEEPAIGPPGIESRILDRSAVLVHLVRASPTARRVDMANTGTVKFFNETRGFGFITTPEGDDVFVHISNVAGDNPQPLTEGQTVTYETAAGRKGPEAINVTPV
jgi:CspA family cold shock protein